jgi:hypothetical protein
LANYDKKKTPPKKSRFKREAQSRRRRRREERNYYTHDHVRSETSCRPVSIFHSLNRTQRVSLVVFRPYKPHHLRMSKKAQQIGPSGSANWKRKLARESISVEKSSPSSSQNLITVIGGRREKSFSL